MKHANEIAIFSTIREWAKSKGILDQGDTKTQYIKFQEEAGEVAKALLKEDEKEIIDGLGDVVVTLVSLAHLAGYTLEDCIDAAYLEIKNRPGKMKNNTFQKTEK